MTRLNGLGSIIVNFNPTTYKWNDRDIKAAIKRFFGVTTNKAVEEIATILDKLDTRCDGIINFAYLKINYVGNGQIRKQFKAELRGLLEDTDNNGLKIYPSDDSGMKILKQKAYNELKRVLRSN